MKNLRLYLMLSLMALPAWMFSQIQLEGSLRMGDTTQTHILYTHSGDKLAGRVLSFDNEYLTFQFGNNQLTFRHQDIEKLVIQEADNTGNPPRQESSVFDPAASDFTYTATLKNGKVYTGVLQRIGKSNLSLQCTGCPSRLRTFEIAELKLASLPVVGQNSEPWQLHLLKTPRGDQFTGQLLEVDSSGQSLFLLENGDTLMFENIEVLYLVLTKVNQAEPSGYNQPIPMLGQEKLMFGGTGFQLPKGKSEFRSAILFFHTYDYGLTDFFSIGAGASTLPYNFGVGLRAKLGFSIGKYVHIGIGGHATGVTSDGDFEDDSVWESIYAAVGSLTLGVRERYLNFGFIRGTENLDENFNSEGHSAFTGFTFGGAYRVSNHWRFFAEHFQVNIDDPEFPDFTSIGLSWLVEKHRLDFGLSVAPYEDNDLVIYPVMGWSVRF